MAKAKFSSVSQYYSWVVETELCTLFTLDGLRACVPVVSAKAKYLQFTSLISFEAVIKNVRKDFANLIYFGGLIYVGYLSFMTFVKISILELLSTVTFYKLQNLNRKTEVAGSLLHESQPYLVYCSPISAMKTLLNQPDGRLFSLLIKFLITYVSI